MKKLRKAINLLLTVSILFGTFNVPVYAIETENEDSSSESTEETSGFDESAHGEVIKDGSQIQENGTNHVWYKLYEDGTLYIYGNGKLNIDDTFLFFDDIRYKVSYVYIEHGINEIGAGTFTCFENMESIVIPFGVTKIGTEAFAECLRIRSIELPDSVKQIGLAIFSECENLERVRLSNELKDISGGMFENCSSLTSIELPSGITSIGENAFENCSSLTSIELPNGITSIEPMVFENCSSLTSIELPSGITSIEPMVFENCSSLTSIELPSGITSIGISAFRNCKKLQNVFMQEGMSLIDNSAFFSCTNLTNIILPHSIKFVYEYAFANCRNLNKVVIQSESLLLEENAFFNCSSLTIHCPSGSSAEEYAKRYNISVEIENLEKPDIEIKNTFNGCKGNPVKLSITCKESDEFTFECSDNCEMQSRYNGYSSYSKNYELIFPKSGEHIISVYKNDSLIEHDKVVIAEKHTWDSGKIESNPTCEKSGSKKYTCLNCKNTKKEILKSTGHKYSKSVVKNATCVSYGIEKYTCTKCRKSYTKNTPKVAHKSGNWKTVIQPTESKTGKEIIACTVCGTTLQERVIKKLNVPKIKLDSKKKTINVGDSCVVKLLNNKKKVKWSVSNKNIRITKKNKKQAKIKGVSSGSAYLKAKVGGKTYKCKITVKKKKVEKSAQGISYELQNTGKGVVAILKNNNSYHVSLTAKIAYYSKGKMVGTASDENYAFEKGRTCALFFHAPYDSNYRDVEYDNYKISISAEEGTNLICGSSKIKVTSNFGADNVSAEIKNNSSDDFSTIQIACVFYDNAGNAIGYDYHYADCKKKGSTDYLDFDFPYDEDYETLFPNKYKIYVNNAYTYTWMK